MKLKRIKGYSLIELVIVLGIIGIILSSISSFFIANLKASRRADEQLEVQQQLQKTLSIFTDRIQNSISISYAENGSDIIYIIEYLRDVNYTDTATDQIKLSKAENKILVNSVDSASCIRDINIIPLDEAGSELLAEEYNTIEKLNNQLSTAKMLKIQVLSQKGNTQQNVSTILFRRNLY